jgi:hypothetical protein
MWNEDVEKYDVNVKQEWRYGMRRLGRIVIAGKARKAALEYPHNTTLRGGSTGYIPPSHATIPPSPPPLHTRIGALTSW